MHLCRKHFARILEMPGVLPRLLEDNFNESRFLASDIIDNGLELSFKSYINSLVQIEDNYVDTNQSPEELLKEAGYYLIECKTDDEIKKMAKYYDEDEMLCSFWEERVNHRLVFFAIKPEATKIKREDFTDPRREDQYSTSVLSIQFTKGEHNDVHIISRYNHSVINPDATFGNNLDHIIPGLTSSFVKKYNLNLKSPGAYGMDIPNYTLANDGRYYKYNYRINYVHYCPNNIIIDNNNVIRRYKEMEKYIIADYFVIDLVNKKIFTYDLELEDSLVDVIGNINKIEVINENDNKTIYFINDNNEVSIMKINKYNRIIFFKNIFAKQADKYFMSQSVYLEDIDMPSLQVVDDFFLEHNRDLRIADFPSLEQVGRCFLVNNYKVYDASFPKLKETKEQFMMHNKYLKTLEMPKLEKVGDWFLADNMILEYFDAPLLEEVEDCFLMSNKSIDYLYLENLRKIGLAFMESNKDYVLITPNIENPNHISIRDKK